LQGIRGDWAAAAKARREFLDRLVETLSRDHWRVTDAPLVLESVEARARMTVDQRRRLAEADQFQRSLLEFHRQGSDKEAVPLARRVVAIRTEMLGERHPDYATSLNNLATLLQEQGNLGAARPLFERALALREEVLGERHPDLLSGLVWAGANRPPTDPITGAVDIGAALKTAEEVSGLDLKGCDLAVLSACETGLGRTAGGDGVLGLQGAFHQAGCRTVVALRLI
jgi:hypothetical protein